MAGIILKNKTTCLSNPISIDFIGAAIIDGNAGGSGPFSTTVDGSAIFIENSPGTIIRLNNLGEIKGIFTGKTVESGAIRIEGSDGVDISGGYVHDNTGSGTSNGAAVYVGGVSRDIYIHHMDLVDQLWDSSGNQSNVCLIMTFDGDGRIAYNSLRYTVAATENCGARPGKHGTCNPDGGGVCQDTFRYDHNLHSNAPGIITFHPNATVDHNVFFDCAGSDNQCGLDRINAFEHCDNGGAGFDGANSFTYNTIKNCGFYSWVPNNDYNKTTLAGCSDCGTFGTLAVDHNIVIDNAATSNQSTAIAMIDPYGSDADFSSNIAHATKPVENYNCVVATGAAALQWSWYAKTSGGSAGDDFTFAQHQSAGYNANGANVDANLTAALVPQHASCTGFGHTVGWLEGGSGGGGGSGAGGAAGLVRIRRGKR